MKDKIEKYFDVLSKASIEDKVWLANNKKTLVAYMSKNPIKKRRFGFLFTLGLTPIMALFLFVVLMSGITYASQDSIPGDVLYSWKISVVEPIESVFIVGTRNRIDFEVERTSKRLREVTKLSLKNNVDQKVADKARKQLENQISVTATKISQSAGKDEKVALDAAVRLGAELNAHQDILATVNDNVEDVKKPQIQDTISSIQSKVDGVQNTIEALKLQTQQTLSQNNSEEDIKLRANESFDTAQSELNELWEKVISLDESSNLRIKAEVNLGYAQDALDGANDFIASSSYNEAMIALQKSKQLISDTRALLDAANDSSQEIKQILRSTVVPSPLVSPSGIPANSSSPFPKIPITPIPTATVKASVSLDMFSTIVPKPEP